MLVELGLDALTEAVLVLAGVLLVVSVATVAAAAAMGAQIVALLLRLGHASVSTVLVLLVEETFIRCVNAGMVHVISGVS